jgi:large subunit ribosomal protein L14e
VVEYPVEIGRLAISTAGRDKGKIFMILDIIDKQYVYIVDGSLRTKDRAKKKKLKHLKLCPEVLRGIADKLREGARVFDAEIRSAIRQSACGGESGGSGA